MAEKKPAEKKPKSTRGAIKMRMSSSEIRPVGRPRTTVNDLPADWKELMIDEAQKGGGPTAFMVRLKIGTHALETLLTDDADFRSTYEDCLLLCRYWWETTGRELASGEREKGNATVWSLNMTNRFNWRSTRSEVIGDKDNPLTVEHSNRELTKEELLEELKKRNLPTSIFEK